MAFISKADLYKNYEPAKADADDWRKEFREFERIASNELISGLDKGLPETSDGSLSAALFKLPKRIVNSDKTGRVSSPENDKPWLVEIANIEWRNRIVPNANTQAPFHRKWKDAVRKAGIYGSVPLLSLFVTRGNYTGSDFIVLNPRDVHVEQGKVSDYDCDYLYVDLWYTKSQIQGMIDQAGQENKDAKSQGRESYNQWKVPNLQALLDKEEAKPTEQTTKTIQDRSVKNAGIKLCMVVQRGVNAPFYLYSPTHKLDLREWTNPDPTGDIPIHFLYCYQDMLNPYGIGIVKLAGGTQNVLDYMRQADVLATQLGLRPPVAVMGDADSADLESIVYEQDALWFPGNAKLERQELATQVYSQIPSRIGMYKNSLNQMLPMGDSSISAESGDPLASKTPAGVKLQAANLSVDDEDFKDNLNITYAAVAKSMINIHFANMQGTDIVNLDEDEAKVLQTAGVDMTDTNQFELVWDQARAEFDFEVDPDADKTTDQKAALDGLTKVADIIKDPAVMQTVQAAMQADGKKLDVGELWKEIIGLLSDNNKIITDISTEEMQAAQAAGQMMPGAIPGAPAVPGAPGTPQPPVGAPTATPNAPQAAPQAPAAPDPTNDPQVQANVQAVMNAYGVDETTALTMLYAESQGYQPQDIVAALQRFNATQAQPAPQGAPTNG